jgi:phosphoserine phosphatase
MSSYNLSETQGKKLSSILKLDQWFRLSIRESIITENALQPCSKMNYLLVFGCEITTSHINKITDFLKSKQIDDANICYFQPDSKLEPALVIQCQFDIAHLKPLIAALSQALSCQLAVFDDAPKITQLGLLVMDMDSTAITIECIDEIARLANVYEEVASVTAQAMSGALEFSDSLKLRVSKLEGIELKLIEKLKKQLPLMPGVLDLCEYLKSKGWTLAIASGGFIPFAERVQQLIGLDFIHANELEVKDDKLTGNVLGVIVDAQEKANFLNKMANELNIDIKQTLAMGDGANDLKMMSAAGLGIAVHGKPKVVKEADVAINDGSLLQVAYFISIPNR